MTNIYSLFLCSPVPLFLCSSVPLFLCSSVPLFLCSSVPLFFCSPVPLFLCSSVLLHSLRLSNYCCPRLRIPCQPIISPLAFFRIHYMPFKFVAEMTDGCRYRPGRRIAQWTNCIAFNLSLNIP